MKRGGPLKRRSRLRPISSKRQAIQTERAVLRIRMLVAHPVCQVQDCRKESAHVHEVLTRARGGSILDESNCRAVCASCHRRIHDNPKWATEQRLLITQYERRDRW